MQNIKRTTNIVLSTLYFNVRTHTSGFKTERNLKTFVSRFFLRNKMEIPLWSK